MARCQCGSSGGCDCVVQAGANTTVTGTGSAANPYVVSSITNCAQVRACLSDGNGINYNPATGNIAACLSADAGNNIAFGTDGCLFVPTGAATVSVGCGIQGNGSIGSPVRANVGTWPFACDVDVNGYPIYCRPSDGQLITDPPVKGANFAQFVGQTYADLVVPAAAATTIFSTSLNIANPDACRAQLFFAILSADVDFRIPPNGSAAYRINNDRQFLYRHGPGTDIGNISVQTNITAVGTIPAGGNVNIPLDVQLGEGAGGATYDAISTGIRAIAYALA